MTVRPKGKSVRHALLAVAIGLLCSMPMGDALAASKVCRQLEAQLARATDGGKSRSSGQTRKYDQAIERQSDQIAIARRQARGADCGFAVFGRAARQCAGLNATISKMERNLATLQRKRGTLAGGGEHRGGKSRARIMASLDANGCRGADNRETVAMRRPQQDVGARAKQKGLIEQLFGEGVATAEPRAEPQRQLVRLDPLTGKPVRRVKRVINDVGSGDVVRGAAALVETFATMCVRTCDGYLFPMSPSSTAADFDRDRKNCETSCPGTLMEVYQRPSGSTEDVAMTSVTTGRPYSQLSTAYLYKNTTEPRPATCGCNAAKNFEVIAGSAPVVEATAVLPQATGSLPTTDLVPDTAPIETSPSITVLGSIGPATTEIIPEPNAAAAAVSDREIDRSANAVAEQLLKAQERKVRVVGPVFLPDPAAAIDLRVPAQTEVQ